MKILVVDDSRAARMLIKSILTEYNSEFELVEAGDGAEAVEIYKQHLPDITFLDLTMPVMDGYEALGLIRGLNPDSVIIILTADVQERSVDKCMKAGAYMVMKKLPQKNIVFKVLDDIIGPGSI